MGSSSEAFQKGGRKGAKKVMIVITDGESHDSPDLERVIQQSERDNVTRYAVAVSPARPPPRTHSCWLLLGAWLAQLWDEVSVGQTRL